MANINRSVIVPLVDRLRNLYNSIYNAYYFLIAANESKNVSDIHEVLYAGKHTRHTLFSVAIREF